MTATYVGIAGADKAALPTETRVNGGKPGPGGATGGNGGNVSAGGILFPNAKINMLQITDGTSNTMLVSEQSNYITTVNGTRESWNASNRNGWLMGAGNIGIPPNYAPGGDNRAFNITTIRWPINKTTGWTDSPGDCSVGVCEDMGGNIPLNSTHDGGVNALFAEAFRPRSRLVPRVDALGDEPAVEFLWAVEANEYGRLVAIVILAVLGVTLLFPSIADWATRPLVALGRSLALDPTVVAQQLKRAGIDHLAIETHKPFIESVRQFFRSRDLVGKGKR